MSFIINGLSKLIGTALPCFYSYKLLKKPTNEKLKQVTQYWTVYGAYSTIDWIAKTFFIACLIPFYDVLSLMFVLYITIPQTGGSNFVYKKILAPFIRQKERAIDKCLNTVYQKIWDFAPSLLSNAANSIFTMLGSMTTTTFQQSIVQSAEEVQEDELNISVDESDNVVEVKLEPIDYTYGDDDEVIIVEKRGRGKSRRTSAIPNVTCRRSSRVASKSPPIDSN